MKAAYIAFVALIPVLAEAPLATPVLGRFVDAGGHKVELTGSRGAFVLRKSENGLAVGLVCARDLCVTKTSTQAIAGTSALDAPGPAIIAVRGNDALLYLKDAQTFWEFREGRWTPRYWHIDGVVVDAGFDAKGPVVAVQIDGVVRVTRPSGEVLRIVATESAVALLDNGIAWVVEDGVKVVLESGQEFFYSLPSASSFFKPSADDLGVRTLFGTFLIRVGEPSVWQIPESPE